MKRKEDSNLQALYTERIKPVSGTLHRMSGIQTPNIRRPAEDMAARHIDLENLNLRITGITTTILEVKRLFGRTVREEDLEPELSNRLIEHTNTTFATAQYMFKQDLHGSTSLKKLVSDLLNTVDCYYHLAVINQTP